MVPVGGRVTPPPYRTPRPQDSASNTGHRHQEPRASLAHDRLVGDQLDHLGVEQRPDEETAASVDPPMRAGPWP